MTTSPNICLFIMGNVLIEYIFELLSYRSTNLNSAMRSADQAWAIVWILTNHKQASSWIAIAKMKYNQHQSSHSTEQPWQQAREEESAALMMNPWLRRREEELGSLQEKSWLQSLQNSRYKCEFFFFLINIWGNISLLTVFDLSTPLIIVQRD